ncbi:MAG: glutaredoxin family protein [Candidatus Saccharimonadales bacterium]
MSDSKNPIIVYGAEWCAFCHVAMDYFDKLGVKYEYRDVDTNGEWLQQAIGKSGQTGIPVLDIQNDIIVGFDRPRIDASLKAHALV